MKMKEKDQKFVKVLFASEVKSETEEAVLKAFDIFSKEAELKRKIPIEIVDLPDYQVKDNKFKKYYSIDQIFNDSQVIGQNKKVDANDILFTIYNILILSNGKNYNKSYYLIITKDYDLKSKDTDFLIGVAYDNFGAIISLLRITGKYLPLNSIPTNLSFDDFEKEMIITEILHEFGHVFGCATKGRKFTVESIGSHCDSRNIDNCVMFQGLTVPDDWIIITKKRLKSEHPFCTLCREELKEHFRL